MRRFGLILVFLLNGMFLSGQVFEVKSIQQAGEVDNRINLVILSDGYRKEELAKFEKDAENFTKAFFAESPYSEYQNYFNVFIIKVPSNESGASHPGTASDVTEPDHPVEVVDNYFGSSFDQYGIHRLLIPTKSLVISNVLASNFPSYDHVLVLVNSPHYGGSGGRIATASLHSASAEVAIHELGHSIVGLKDEYYAGDGYASEAINMTQEKDPAKVKWKNWINQKEIGVHQHCCGGNSASWYHPHENCKMRYLGAPFCAVCVEGTIEKIHSLVSPIDSFLPADTALLAPQFPVKFEVNTINPKQNTLKIKWVLNGADLKKKTPSVSVSADQLKPGRNTLTAFVQDTTKLLKVDRHEKIHTFSVSWTIENGEVKPSNAQASALALNEGTLSPAFAPGTTNYKASVSNEVTSLKITPTAEDPKAIIKVNEKVVVSGAASSAIPLKIGSNLISVVITAQDGTTTKSYSIEVTREKSANANAAGLALSKGTLTPAFNSEKIKYTASIGHEVSSVTVTPTVAHEGATVKVNDKAVASGTASSAIPLKEGNTVISVIVTAQNGTATKTYTIEVSREKALAKVAPEVIFQNGMVSFGAGSFQLAASSNSTGAITYQVVEELTASYPGDVTLSGNGKATVTVVKSGKVRLRADVAEDDQFLAASKEMDLTIQKAVAKISITELNQPFNGKERPVVVTTEPGGLKVNVLYNGSEVVPIAAGEYEVKALVVSDNYSGEAREKLTISAPSAAIAGLAISNGALSPAFAPGITNYWATVPNATTSITLTPTAEDPKATVKVNGKTVVSGTTSPAIPLQVGENIIPVVVTALDGTTTRTYSIEVTREGNANANIAGLVLSEGTLNPSFSPAIRNYTAAVEYEVTSVTVIPTLENPQATVTVNGMAVSSGNPSSSIVLNEGSNSILLVVRAQEGSTKTYSLEIIRESAPPKVAPEVAFQSESVTYQSESFELAASSNSTSPITYEVVEELTSQYPGDVTLSGPGNRIVHVVKAGKVRLRATVVEDDQYLAHSSEVDLHIEKAPAAIEISELNQIIDEEPRPVVVRTDPEGLAVEVLYNGSEEVPTAAGEYEVVAMIVDANYSGEAKAKLVILNPTAVSSLEMGKEVKLYPNPTLGKAKLELKTGTQAYVRVRDLTGRLISQGQMIDTYEVNLENYAAGMYFIEVQPNGKAAVSFKLQKH